eukprot:c9773_g1_i1.p1 GENE.c9773_g1_i1~~c9773_g1_i1.p1  ORF type:complete len:352 (+),score=35.94 c9773_g1_i1:98-1153(+)
MGSACSSGKSTKSTVSALDLSPEPRSSAGVSNVSSFTGMCSGERVQADLQNSYFRDSTLRLSLVEPEICRGVLTLDLSVPTPPNETVFILATLSLHGFTIALTVQATARITTTGETVELHNVSLAFGGIHAITMSASWRMVAPDHLRPHAKGGDTPALEASAVVFEGKAALIVDAAVPQQGTCRCVRLGNQYVLAIIAPDERLQVSLFIPHLGEQRVVSDSQAADRARAVAIIVDAHSDRALSLRVFDPVAHPSTKSAVVFSSIRVSKDSDFRGSLSVQLADSKGALSVRANIEAHNVDPTAKRSPEPSAPSLSGVHTAAVSPSQPSQTDAGTKAAPPAHANAATDSKADA